MDKFSIQATPGGFLEVRWKGVLVCKGRPWIEDPALNGYSELLLKILEDERNYIWEEYPSTQDKK